MMVDTRRAASMLADDHAAEAAGLLATSYRLAAGLSGRLGLVDLAAHAAHRALDTARFTTRPELDEAAALRYLAWVLVRQDDLAGAERIAVRAAERLDGGLLTHPDGDRHRSSARAKSPTTSRCNDTVSASRVNRRRSSPTHWKPLRSISCRRVHNRSVDSRMSRST